MSSQYPELKGMYHLRETIGSGKLSLCWVVYQLEMGKDICVNVTCLGSCNFLLSKAT